MPSEGKGVGGELDVWTAVKAELLSFSNQNLMLLFFLFRILNRVFLELILGAFSNNMVSVSFLDMPSGMSGNDFCAFGNGNGNWPNKFPTYGNGNGNENSYSQLLGMETGN